MLAARQRLITLHVDVDVGIDGLRDFVNAIGAAAMLGRGQAIAPAILPADGGNLLRVGCHDDILQLGAGARGFVNMREHGTAGDVAKDLARQPGGGESGRNDGDGVHEVSFAGERTITQARSRACPLLLAFSR